MMNDDDGTGMRREMNARQDGEKKEEIKNKKLTNLDCAPFWLRR
jgi:hypothetical protein